jgi:hypothetical protein
MPDVRGYGKPKLPLDLLGKSVTYQGDGMAMIGCGVPELGRRS